MINSRRRVIRSTTGRNRRYDIVHIGTGYVRSRSYADADAPVIIFNGKFLPASAHFIDMCSDRVLQIGNENEDIAVWFWRFTICVGRPREEKSENVIRYADYLLNRILSAKEKVKRKTAFLYSDYHSRQKSERIVNEWIQTLNIIRLSAERCTLCKWYAIFNLKYFSDERKAELRLSRVSAI